MSAHCRLVSAARAADNRGDNSFYSFIRAPAPLNEAIVTRESRAPHGWNAGPKKRRLSPGLHAAPDRQTIVLAVKEASISWQPIYMAKTKGGRGMRACELHRGGESRLRVQPPMPVAQDPLDVAAHHGHHQVLVAHEPGSPDGGEALLRSGKLHLRASSVHRGTQPD